MAAEQRGCRGGSERSAPATSGSDFFPRGTLNKPGFEAPASPLMHNDSHKWSVLKFFTDWIRLWPRPFPAPYLPVRAGLGVLLGCGGHRGPGLASAPPPPPAGAVP